MTGRKGKLSWLVYSLILNAERYLPAAPMQHQRHRYINPFLIRQFLGFTTGSAVVLRWLWSWLPPLLPRSSSLWASRRGVVLLSLYSGVPCQVSGEQKEAFLIRKLNMQMFFILFLFLLLIDGWWKKGIVGNHI